MPLPFLYSHESYSQESLSLGSGVFKPRESFCQQVIQRCHNHARQCTTTRDCKNANTCLPDIEDLATRYNDSCSISSSSLSSGSDDDEEDDSGTLESCTMTATESDNATSHLGLDSLPFEIRQIIAQECLQADAFHLSLTCKALYQSTIQRLYQCIIFDSSHRHFNKELSSSRLQPALKGEEGIARYFSYTSVRTVGGLRTCIRALRSPEKAALVRRFELLAATDLPDLEIRMFVAESFPLMKNLGILVWGDSLAPELSVNMLMNLASPEKVQTLCLDHLSCTGMEDMRFEGLRRLSVRPFTGSAGLRSIAQMISNSKSTVTNLTSLYLGREIRKNQEVGSGFAFTSINPAAGPGTTTLEDDTMQAFFGTISRYHPGHKLRLTQLGLEGVTVQLADFATMDKCVDFGFITHLNLVGVDTTHSRREHNNEDLHRGPRFLPSLGSKLNRLESLQIEWSESYRDTVPELLCSLQGLRSLSVKIRWNKTKAEYLDWPTLSTNYTAAIALHANTLKQLALDAVEEVPFYDPSKDIPACALIPLQALMRLEALSIAVPSPHSSVTASRTLAQLLANLPALRFFHLRNHSTKPYLGQPSSYLLEDWLRYKQTVEYFISNQELAIKDKEQKGLEFIKLEEYVFDVRERKGPPVIREGLMRWFDEQVFEPWEQ